MQESIQRSFEGIGPFVIDIVAAVAVLIVGYIVAKLIAGLIRKALNRSSFDNRVGRALSREGDKVETERLIAKGVFWVIMIFVIVAVLQILNLTFVTEPLNRFLSTVFAFIPQLIAAAILVFVAYVVATLLKFLTQKVLHAADVDRRFQKEVVEEKGTDTPSPTAQRVSISDALANVVYYLVWLFFLPAILDTLELGGVLRPVEQMVAIILGALPNIVAAIIVLVLAYVVGKVVAGVISNVLRSVGFNRMMANLGLGKETAEGAVRADRSTPADFVGTFVLVAIMLFATMEAANLLGFVALNVLLAELLTFLGQIILGLIVLGVGLYLANLAYRAIRDSGGEQAELLAVVARVAIVVFAGAMAFKQMGIADSIINLAFGLTLGAIAVAAAIAFGIGGRDFARQQLAKLESASGAPAVLKPSSQEPGMERGPEKQAAPRKADSGASAGESKRMPPPGTSAPNVTPPRDPEE